MISVRGVARVAVVAAAMVLAAANLSEAAADSAWQYTSSGNWSDAAKWSAGVPNGLDAVARFPKTPCRGQTITIDDGVPGSGPTVGALWIADNASSSSSYCYTIAAAAGKSLTFDSSTGNAFLQVDGTGGSNYLFAPVVLNDSLTVNVNMPTFRIYGAVSSGNYGTGIEKTGPGQLVLSGANSYTGPTIVSEGILLACDGNSLGAPGAPLIVRDGASFMAFVSTDHTIMGKPMELRGAGVDGTGAFIGAGSGATWTGRVTLAADCVVSNASEETVVFAGPLRGSGALSKIGACGLTLSAPGTQTGPTTVQEGLLTVTHSTALGVGPAALTMANGTVLALEGNITVSGKPLTLSGLGFYDKTTDTDYAAIHNNQGNNRWEGPVHLAGDTMVGATSGILTIAGAIDGNFSLDRYKGDATVVLAGANTYTGRTTVSQGILEARDGVGLPQAGNLAFYRFGVFQVPGGTEFTRSLGTGAGQVQWDSSLLPQVGGGFAARGGKAVVNLGGNVVPTPLVWGSTPNFLTSQSTLLMNSTSADSEIEFRNPVNLGGAQRYIRVYDNTATGGDFATLSGAISNGTIIKLGTGTLFLKGANSAAIIIQEGALRATDGVGLPSASNLVLQYTGVLEGNGPATFTRSLGTGAGQVRWTGAGSAGFSASGGKMTVNIGGSATPQTLTWGSSNFVASGSTLRFGSATADSETDFRNPINFNTDWRNFSVSDNPGTDADFATLSGVLSNGGLLKGGAGTLVLAAGNTYTKYTTVAGTGTGLNLLYDGVLRARDGVGLPAASPLVLDRGVLEGIGQTTFTRALGTTAGTVSMPNGGGFSAFGGKTTVNLGGSGATLIWGSTANFVANGKSLAFGSGTANAETEFLNPLDLGGAARTIIVNDNAFSDGDFATLVGGVSNGALTKAGRGVLVMKGAKTYTGTTTVSEGTLRLAAGATLASTVFDVAAGAALEGVGGFTLPPGATLKGNGSVLSGLTVGGTLSPGGSIGAFACQAVTFSPGSVLDMELAEAYRGAGYDVLSATGLSLTGGTLSVRLINGFHPERGDVFDLLDFGSLTGGFSTVALPDLDPGLSWDATRLYADGTIQVVPEPGVLSLLTVGGIAALCRRRKTREC